MYSYTSSEFVFTLTEEKLVSPKACVLLCTHATATHTHISVGVPRILVELRGHGQYKRGRAQSTTRDRRVSRVTMHEPRMLARARCAKLSEWESMPWGAGEGMKTAGKERGVPAH
jgi:hypothetical protein